MPAFDARGITRLRTALLLLNFDLEFGTAAAPGLAVVGVNGSSRFRLELPPAGEARIEETDRVERRLLVRLFARAGQDESASLFLIGIEDDRLFARKA